MIMIPMFKMRNTFKLVYGYLYCYYILKQEVEM